MSLAGINLSVVCGVLSSPPTARTLPSGDELVSLEVTVRPEEGRADTVPVAWPGAPASCLTWEAGQPVLLVGRVRRRFFRAGGSTASRTEVVADAVVTAGKSARAKKLLAGAREQLAVL